MKLPKQIDVIRSTNDYARDSNGNRIYDNRFVDISYISDQYYVEQYEKLEKKSQWKSPR